MASLLSRTKHTATRQAARITGQHTYIPYAFLAAPLALYSMWVIGPMCYSFYMSLTNADGLTQNDFIGFQNYIRLFRDPVFQVALVNNLRWLVVFMTVPTAIGLGLALLLNTDLPGIRLIKAGFFSPMVLSSVVIGMVWSWMYFPTDGLINQTLALFGYTGKPIGWLADPKLVTWAVLGAAAWRQAGYVMLLYLAGLNNVDPTLVDAAFVDGANFWQRFRHVIFPLLQPITAIVVVISIIDALRAFDLINIMTRGGPYNQSNVLAQMMYIEAFNNYNMGYGAAIAVVLFLISLLFIGVYLWRVLSDELDY